MEETKVYQTSDFLDEVISATLKDVIEILEERGYDPIKQIVGYLISGDPGYITSHKEARKKITKYDRNKILEFLVRNYNK